MSKTCKVLQAALGAKSEVRVSDLLSFTQASRPSRGR